MSKTITLIVPHQLSQEEARRRIQIGIEDLRRQYAAQVGQMEVHWTGNHVEGRCTVLRQTITGQADVEAERVVVHVDLPWLLAKLVGNIQPRIQSEAAKLLSR
jgi:hypothetical protein